jgi:AraC family transcriptional regulator
LLPEHLHAGPFVTYVLRGSFTEEVGSVRRDYRHGSVLFHAGGECHANVVGPAGTASLNVEITPQCWSALTRRDATARAVVGQVISGDIEWLAFRVWREFHRDDHASVLGLDEAVAGLCEAVVDGVRQPTRDAKRRADLTAELIGEGLAPVPRLAEVARLVGVHPMHLSRLFRRRYGCSMGEFVRRRRIAWACGQLADDSLTIAGIAAMAGFADHAHFTRTFRRLTGCTPTWFRNRVVELESPAAWGARPHRD